MLSHVANPSLCSQSSTWIIVSKGNVLVSQETGQLPELGWDALVPLHAYHDEIANLKDFDGNETGFYLVDVGAEPLTLQGYEFVSLRQAMMNTNHEPFGVIGRAWQFLHFYNTHRFCGRCGTAMTRVDWEVAVHCHQCGHRCYPRVSPCVIVAIYRKGQILLAQGNRHQTSGFFSTIAGFVESGESLEQAVVREVYEEVGVRIKKPEYFGSQPWPFPHALMVGYLAEWQEGDIVIDEHEIAQAHWFDVENLPKTPPKFSIAGQLIEQVVQRQNQ
ncbi:NAD(+) diphosphatase [Alteromonas sediminis]|uniref:NAD(+) diphosphatase n=1 Tax=Alteromonas sediminis TaxID=2259342 RepID=A0A3N5XXR6_9ALTE|nr:NAD(+) diphosphatase [Alteromonas sediminis]RPJ65263.1 NAD(+) diphosphatase [Alteromonas sediminis]